MRSLPTASALPRVLACPASHVLPHVIELAGNQWSDRGNAVHAFIADAKTNGRDAALAKAPEEHRQLCAALPLDRIPDGAHFEIAMAWDYSTGEARVLGENIGRAYDARPTEYAGTADLMGIDGDVAVVIDWKSGFRSLGPAEASKQLGFLAMVAAKIAGKDKARVAFGWLRDDEIRFDWGELDVFALSAIEEELVDLAERLRWLSASQRTPDVVTGEHCQYCPSKRSCPAYVGLAPVIHNELPAVVDQLSALTPEQLGETWRKAKMAEDVIESVKRGIREIAADTPVPIGAGKYLRAEERKHISVDGAKVLELLTAEFDSEVGFAAVELKATLTSIDAALANMPKALRKAVLEMLEREGAIRVGRRTEIREGKLK